MPRTANAVICGGTSGMECDVTTPHSRRHVIMPAKCDRSPNLKGAAKFLAGLSTAASCQLKLNLLRESLQHIIVSVAQSILNRDRRPWISRTQDAGIWLCGESHHVRLKLVFLRHISSAYLGARTGISCTSRITSIPDHYAMVITPSVGPKLTSLVDVPLA
jgi:hypothetical protein